MIWAALAFFVVAIAGSIAYAAVRGWRLWRTVGGTSKRTSEAVGRVSASAATAEARATRLTANTERLSAALERLQEALAELAVIRAAAAEPQALLATIRGIVPSK